jgi:hypothetical protein
LRWIPDRDMALDLNSDEFVHEKLIKHFSQAIGPRLPNVWLEPGHFNVKKVDLRIKVTRVRRDVSRGYRALGVKSTGKRMRLKLTIVELLCPQSCTIGTITGWSAFSSRSTNSKISACAMSRAWATEHNISWQTSMKQPVSSV